MAPPVEITIPTTSVTTPPDGGKAFTQYNITLHLPLRSYVVQKRFSDFTALHTTLTSAVGTPPPAPLPAKHWFKSTISSPELTEDRRRALESYLKAIAESPDRRWRDTPAWRGFLNLPAATAGSTSTASALNSGVPAIAPRDATLAAARDPRTWMDLHREAKALLGEARSQLARRDALSDGGGGGGAGGGSHTAAIEAGAEAKRRLVLASNRLRAMDDGLRDMAAAKKLGEGELRRRRDLVAALKGERDGLEKLGASVGRPVAGAGAPTLSNGRDGVAGGAVGDKAAALFRGGGGGGGSRRVLGAPLPETERTRELDNEGVMLLRRRQMAEQDQDVEELTRIVRRQKELGLAIQSEVEEQSAMLDEFETNVGRVGAKVDVAKKNVRKLGM